MISEAYRLAKRAGKRHKGRVRQCGLLYCLMMGAWCALVAACSERLPMWACFAVGGYLYALIHLAMQMMLRRAISREEKPPKPDAKSMRRLFLLPCLNWLPLSAVYGLGGYVNRQWTTLIGTALASAGHMALAAGVLAAAALLLGWLFSLIDEICSRALTDAMRGGHSGWGRLTGDAFRYSLIPMGLFFRFFPTFLGAGILWLALEMGAGYLLKTFALQATFADTLLVLLTHLMMPHVWWSAAAFWLGGVCMLGVGGFLWTRYHLARLCCFYRQGL